MKEQTKKLNIYDVADKAGVSIATISRVINPATRNNVAPETLKKIDKLIQKYGYTPNVAAQHLSLTATKTIGVVFPYLPGIFYSNYYNHILAGVSEYLFDTDYQFKMVLLKVDQDRWNHYDFKAGDRVDGLLLTHWFFFFSNKSAIENMNIPCVVINDIDESIKTQFVGVDQYLGGRIAANHLYSMGHRRIAIISGPTWSLDNTQRTKGFKDFFKEKGIDIDKRLIVRGNYLEDVAYGEVEKIIKTDSKITAIFACNDQMAFGAIKKLKELGYSCPKDISVMGFDDEIDSAKYMPALTTIHVPIYDLAQEGTKLLINHLQSSAPQKPLRGELTLPTHLVERESVKKINS